MRGEFEKNAQGSKEESVEKREPSEKFKAAEAAIICLDVSMQGALGISASERDLVFLGWSSHQQRFHRRK